MGQDSDVARVAAAMNAPGFKYRSFGNEPVRIRPGAAGTLAQPPAPPSALVDDVVPSPEPLPPTAFAPEPFPPEPYAPEPYAPEPYAPEPYAPGPLAYEDTPPALFTYDSFPEPLPERAPVMAEPAPAPVPAPAAAAPPQAAPLFSWPEAPSSPPPAPMSVAAPVLLPQVAEPYAPAAPPPRAPMSAGGFRLLESIGHRPGETAPLSATGQPGGTLGLLRRAAEAGDGAGTTLAGVSGASPYGGLMPPLSPSGHQSGLLPAAAVTVPLSDVMRLIAAGATPPPSPFDAFRAALGAQPGR